MGHLYLYPPEKRPRGYCLLGGFGFWVEGLGSQGVVRRGAKPQTPHPNANAVGPVISDALRACHRKLNLAVEVKGLGFRV